MLFGSDGFRGRSAAHEDDDNDDDKHGNGISACCCCASIPSLLLTSQQSTWRFGQKITIHIDNHHQTKLGEDTTKEAFDYRVHYGSLWKSREAVSSKESSRDGAVA